MDIRGSYKTLNLLAKFLCKHIEAEVNSCLYAVNFSNNDIAKWIITNCSWNIIEVSSKYYAVIGTANSTSPMPYSHVMVCKGNELKCNAGSCRKSLTKTKQVWLVNVKQFLPNFYGSICRIYLWLHIKLPIFNILSWCTCFQPIKFSFS